MLIMLDLDNTLCDRAKAVNSWVAEFLADRGLPADDRAWILAHDNDGYTDRRAVFEAIADRYALPETADTLLAAYRQRVIELSTPTPGATQCLQDLRSAGHATAIVSNGSSTQQHAKIDALGFRELVDAVIVSADLDIAKPDARIFQTASRATGIPLDRAWMVGDSALHDIVGGSAVGSKTAWLHRGRSWSEAIVEPTVTISSLVDLVPAVRANESG